MTPLTPPEIDVPLPVYYPPLHLDNLESQLSMFNNPSISQTSLESSKDFTVVSNPPVSSSPVDSNLLQIVLVVAVMIVFVSIAVTKSKRNPVSYNHNA